MTTASPHPTPPAAPSSPSTAGDVARFVGFSAIGIFMFFVPIKIGAAESIPLDHIVRVLRAAIPGVLPWYALAIVFAGTVVPFTSGAWKASRVRMVFAFANVVGLAACVALVLGRGPGWLMEPDIGPFLFKTLVIPVGLLVPIGAVFLALLVGYGLMEFIGVLVRPLMRPVWNTPGRSAIDAVASFVGSYSLALLITNRVYREGRYTGREAAIIATGFSTVSATFMVVVAKTLGIMEYWLLYFWLSIVVTFVVTAITVRIPPLSRVTDEPFPGVEYQPEEVVTSGRFAAAWAEARRTLHAAPPVGRYILDNLRDGFAMARAILPSILSIGLAGLLLAKHTPVFDILGYLFVPFAWLGGISDPTAAGQASATGIAEMFLPATQVADHPDLGLRLVVAIVSVSAIIFFSAMVPTILATDIPVGLGALVVLWFERTALSLVLAGWLVALLL